MSKRTDYYFKFHEKMQFTDIFENGKKLSKSGVFSKYYKERSDNAELVLIMACMHPKYEYVKSDRMNDVDKVMLEEDSLKSIMTKRAMVFSKKSRTKMDESGVLTITHENLVNLLIKFGTDCYENHEKIFEQI